MTWTREALVSLLLATAGLAGCLGGEEGIDTASTEASSTLAEPPEPKVGDWWTFEVRHEASQTAAKATVVVTDRTEDTATIGLASDGFHHRFLLLHLPPLGTVELGSLSWQVMWDRFQPAVFPLEPGQTWTTTFHGAEVEAEVTEVSEDGAQVVMVGDSERVELAYDAAAGMVSDLHVENYGASLELVDHGSGFEGSVERFSNLGVGFFTGRIGNAVDTGLRPAAPVETVEVPDDISEGTLGLIVANVAQDGAAPGGYRAAAQAPDGTNFEAVFTPTPDDPALIAEYHGHDAVQGTWQLDFEAAGPGAVAAELIVYDRQAIELG